MLVAAIGAMKKEIDSHDVIIEVARMNQSEYIAQLQTQISSSAPFNQVHSSLGRVIAEICRQEGYAEKPHRSNDIFRQDASCTLWTKNSL
jgi:hypothetical protein